MTTLTQAPGATQAPAASARQGRAVPAPIPFTRILRVELQKMFDTRSGFWLMWSIVISALLATASVIAFAPESAQTYDNFGAAIGFPMVVILPVIAILSVTSEWSQRSGLTTFTLVPHRGRVLRAKLTLSVLVGAASIVVALGIGALGNLVGATIAGIDPVWDISLEQAASIVLANVLGLVFGFMLGVLIRNSPGALVAYFVSYFVMAPLAEILAATQDWFADARPWVDFNYTQGTLFEGNLTGEQWVQLGVTSVLWILVPLVVGLLLTRRSEVK
jgi:ABC-2 type transport system permease protein